MNIVSAYDYETKKKNAASAKVETGEGLTEQSQAKECDINNILRKYQKTGALEHRNENRGEYGFASAATFQECMEVVAKGNSIYEELPSSIRQQFDGPARFLEFVQDPSNAEKLVEMGLATSVTDIASETPQNNPTQLQLKEEKPSVEGESQ